MGQWLVSLRGDSSDLAQLAGCKPNTIADISLRNGEYVLKSSTLIESEDADTIYRKALEILDLVNGGARLFLDSKSPIKVFHVIRVDDNCDETHYMYLADQSVGRDPVRVVEEVDGIQRTIEPVNPVLDWIAMGRKNPNVARALQLMTGEFTWVNMYRLYEVIQDDLGGKGSITSRGWASDNKIDLFKHTANHSAVLGGDARHGSQSKGPTRLSHAARRGQDPNSNYSPQLAR